MSIIIFPRLISNTAIDNAGNKIKSQGNKALPENFEIIQQWRKLHAMPLNALQVYIRRKLYKTDYSKVIIVQRLKRMPSIISKIQRIPSMRMSRMQDVGGIRIIAKNINDVYQINKLLTSSKRSSFEPIVPPHDYIEKPKEDGYRSLHQVVKYKGSKSNELHKGFRLEIQIRTLLQHYWATAVETLGMVDRVSYKSGHGEQEVKEFFRYASALFAIKENCNVLESLKDYDKKFLVEHINELDEKLKITHKLDIIAKSSRDIEESIKISKDAYYFVLDLTVINDNHSVIKISPFNKKSLDEAETLYTAKEYTSRDDENKSLLLLSAQNVTDMKKAYPNYFLETQNFISTLKEAKQY